ncbi:MAG TPA: ZIP family metal transporter [Actinomycetota bacterium]|nr:ZIP family metal transporter [Actinomycetota bacterium]
MATATTSRMPRWLGALAPLVLIAVMVAVFLGLDPIGGLRSTPPVESLAFERTVLHPGSIEMHVRNDGVDPVTISQVIVNDSYWNFTVGDRSLERLRSTNVVVSYPWEEGLPLDIGIVTSTGLTITHEIPVAAETPETTGKTFLIYGLLGLYIGVIPIAIGLLWFPALRRASPAWLGFFLAFTLGLLSFLLVDTVAEGLELAGDVPAVLNGIVLFAVGVLASVLGLLVLGGRLARRRGSSLAGLTLAYLVAAGIGLHNLGEGLAVGAAVAAGEVALGGFLVLGFALHNTTEGLAIVAPLGRDERRPSLWHFVLLGIVAGAPTIAGAWIGGFAFLPAFAAFAFGIAAGAIAQVIWAIGRSLPKEAGLTSGIGAAGFLVGLATLYVTSLFT